jgi:hypothetical protein
MIMAARILPLVAIGGLGIAWLTDTLPGFSAVTAHGSAWLVTALCMERYWYYSPPIKKEGGPKTGDGARVLINAIEYARLDEASPTTH